MNDLANEQAPEAQADHENHIDTVRVHLLDQLKALRQFKKASRPLVRAQRPCDAIHRSGRRLAVVVRCVRQHDRVHLCMGKIEASAQYVARLVVQSHGGRPERGSCKPRAV